MFSANALLDNFNDEREQAAVFCFPLITARNMMPNRQLKRASKQETRHSSSESGNGVKSVA
jgi:hypothetical protein